jgi:hypothetical protein
MYKLETIPCGIFYVNNTTLFMVYMQCDYIFKSGSASAEIYFYPQYMSIGAQAIDLSKIAKDIWWCHV